MVLKATPFKLSEHVRGNGRREQGGYKRGTVYQQSKGRQAGRRMSPFLYETPAEKRDSISRSMAGMAGCSERTIRKAMACL